MDSQTLEILGRNWLVNRLLEDRLEVARPERDHGVDLVAYVDVAEAGHFVARPIQLKAASGASFTIDRKFDHIDYLLIAYIWLGEESAFALTYPEAVQIGMTMGYTATASWLTRGLYTSTRPSQKLRFHLEPYRMNAGDWWRRVTDTG